MSTTWDMNTVLDLSATMKALESMSPSEIVGNPLALMSAIDTALAPDAPGGSPTSIYSAAAAHGTAAEQYGQAFDDLQKIHSTTLPAAWRSPAATKAAQHIQAIGVQVQNTVSAFSLVREVLAAWSDTLQQAQPADEQARKTLTAARSAAASLMMRGTDTFGDGTSMLSATSALGVATQAWELAQEGCNLRLAIAEHLTRAASTATTVLTQTAGYATARKVVDAGPLTAALVATAQNTDGTPILSANALNVGKQRWEALSPEDRIAMEGLLAGSESPQEAAYLWEAMSAGNSVKTIEAFDKAIHPYGKNNEWLADHLSPNLAALRANPTAEGESGSGQIWWGNGSGSMAGYQGQADADQDQLDLDIYDQGNAQDCVAASTVVARANADPVYMLGLTTGFNPASSNPVLGDDSPAAFHTRLQQAYISEDRVAQATDMADNPKASAADGGHFSLQNAVFPQGENAIANQELAKATGSSYHYESLSGPADRQAVLTQIETAAASGKPVLLNVESPAGTPDKDVIGHQVAVVGYQNGQLEIYNPWGYTEYVDPSQLVDGNLPINSSGTASGAMPDADGVELPND